MFDRVEEALRGLAEVDLDGLSDGELSAAVLWFQRMRGALEGAEARVLQRWDAQRCWQAEGAKTGRAWLTARCRIPGGVAGQRLHHARQLRALPAVLEAWTAGEIDRCHVTTLVRARTPRTVEVFDRDHKELLDAARTRSFKDFKRDCDWWSYTADPDGAEDRAAKQRDGREFHHSQSFQGVFFTRGTFDPIGGTIVEETLKLFSQELFEQDWAEAKERLGREPLTQELRRTPAQRRADAVVLMAQRARTAPADGRTPAPLFTIVAGYETFAGPVCELWNRTTVTPGSLVPWLDTAQIERIVFDGPSRVIDVGARRRLFRGALRRAIEIRDRGCFHPMCDDVPDPAQAQIDHIIEASKGGETTQANGRLGCAFHNRRRNQHPDDWNDDDVDLSSCATSPGRLDGPGGRSFDRAGPVARRSGRPVQSRNATSGPTRPNTQTTELRLLPVPAITRRWRSPRGRRTGPRRSSPRP